jgi:hypothetical protein
MKPDIVIDKTEYNWKTSDTWNPQLVRDCYIVFDFQVHVRTSWTIEDIRGESRNKCLQVLYAAFLFDGMNFWD